LAFRVSAIDAKSSWKLREKVEGCLSPARGLMIFYLQKDVSNGCRFVLDGSTQQIQPKDPKMSSHYLQGTLAAVGVKV